MLAKTIILSAPDGAALAEEIQDNLRQSGAATMTLEDFSRSHGLDISPASTYQVCIEHFEVVICVVTSGLFANCHPSAAVRCAIGLGKLISVQRIDEQVIVPGWFALSQKFSS